MGHIAFIGLKLLDKFVKLWDFFRKPKGYSGQKLWDIWAKTIGYIISYIWQHYWR